MKGKVAATLFVVTNQAIPNHGEPITSLGCVHNVLSTSKSAVQHVQETENWFGSYQQKQTNRKFQDLSPSAYVCSGAPCSLCIFIKNTSAKETIERKINKAGEQWLGALPCLLNHAIW